MNATPPVVSEYDARAGEMPSDDLFLERLETFMEKCLGDIRAFAERELRPYEETRRCIAQWHAKHLFQPSADPSVPSRSAQVRSTLCNTSSILESLSETAGVQSFLLAIDPNDPSDAGFLGGSLVGREFWRGMRGGGDTGARSFKAFYIAHSQTISKAGLAAERYINPTPPPLKGKGPEGPARFLKNELYETVRNALRTTSGVRNAEMKWTNPEKLDTYGVRLVGWPENVPPQNPSMLKTSQNKLLHEAMLSGSMRFEKLPRPQPGGSGDGSSGQLGDPNDDFSWAYDADARLPSPPPPERVPTRPSSPAQRPLTAATPTPPDISEPVPNAWTVDPAVGVESLASYNVDYAWGDEISHGLMDGLGAEWDSDPHSQIERPRKRPRSEEPGSAMDGHVLK